MKKLNSLSDLAIHGAPPAFAEPVHVGRPNLGSREAFLRYANEIFDRRWLSNNGPLVQEFERRLADFLGVKQCVAMCNGTLALEIATRALELRGEVTCFGKKLLMASLSFQPTPPIRRYVGIFPCRRYEKRCRPGG